MSSDDSPRPDSHVTTDPERVREWGTEYDVVPVRRSGTGGDQLDLVESTAVRDDDEELSWDAFEDELTDRDDVVVMDESEPPTFSVMDREDVYGQADDETETIEEALERGETVRTGLAETTTVEKTIVEEVTLESELVDSQIVDSTVVDAELVDRSVDHCTVDLATMDGADVDFAQFESGAAVTDALDVEVEVDEGWTLTKEVIEELVVESRVVESEATEAETSESEAAETDTLASSVDAEGVHQTLLEGDLLATDAGSAAVERGSIESEFHEDDRIETTLVERKTVEEEVSVRKEFVGQITDGETIAVDSLGSQTIESEIVDREEHEGGAVARTADETAAAGETPTPEGTAAAGETARTDETATADAGHRTPTEDDEGKTVVDANGEELGLVVEVEGTTAYVDPHPSLTDRIKAALDWGEPDEDAYPLDEDRIDEITDDEVRLHVGE